MGYAAAQTNGSEPYLGTASSTSASVNTPNQLTS